MKTKNRIGGALAAAALFLFAVESFAWLGTLVKKLYPDRGAGPKAGAPAPGPALAAKPASPDACVRQKEKNALFVDCNGIYE